MTVAQTQPISDVRPAQASPRRQDRSAPPKDGNVLSEFDALLRAAGAFAQPTVAATVPQSEFATAAPSQAGSDARAERMAVLQRDDQADRTQGQPRIALPREAADGRAPAGDSAPQPKPESTEASTKQQGVTTPAKPSAQDSSTARGGTIAPPRDVAPDAPRSDVTQTESKQPATDRLDNGATTKAQPVTEASETSRAPKAAVPAVQTSIASSTNAAPASVAKVTAVQSTGSEARTGSQGDQQNLAESRGRPMASRAGVNEKNPVEHAQKPQSTGSKQQAAFDRIAQIVKAGTNKNESVVSVRLDPASLGSVNVNMRVQGDLVRIRLMADSPEAKRTLLSQLDELRASIEQQGLRIERVEVVARSDGDQASMNAPHGDDTRETATPQRDPELRREQESPSDTGDMQSSFASSDRWMDEMEESDETDVRVDIRV
jgi:flagellar hook-length control protein FliK